MMKKQKKGNTKSSISTIKRIGQKWCSNLPFMTMTKILLADQATQKAEHTLLLIEMRREGLSEQGQSTTY